MISLRENFQFLNYGSLVNLCSGFAILHLLNFMISQSFLQRMEIEGAVSCGNQKNLQIGSLIFINYYFLYLFMYKFIDFHMKTKFF